MIFQTGFCRMNALRSAPGNVIPAQDEPTLDGAAIAEGGGEHGHRHSAALPSRRFEDGTRGTA
jgi:hypothetical protein